MVETNPRTPLELETVVEAFELQRSSNADTDLRDFVPHRDHPQYADIVVELVRVDLEFSYRESCPSTIGDYRAMFPDVLGDPEVLSQVAFEEYRLAFRAGVERTPDEYREKYGIDTSEWPIWSRVFDSAYRQADAGAAPAGWNASLAPSQLTTAADSPALDERFPKLGDEFCDFHLVAELGRGAFGRVFLARQGDLADRFVALKITVRPNSEPQRLAELQHTHIVPIYSLHREGDLQGVCMPFLGAATLADVLHEVRHDGSPPSHGKDLTEAVAERHASVLRSLDGEPKAAAEEAESSGSSTTLEQLAEMTYVDAITWIGARIAEGLAHAHDRGVIHRDLKPANVLLTDDGQPLILDFNLSTSTGSRGVDSALVGGTLPFMAPEHIQALRTGRSIDARSDVFAMGVILFELLAGRSPFPIRRGPLEFVTARMLEDRRQTPPSVSSLNPQASPDLAAIVSHCLRPHPTERYPSARELHTDLERHLHSLPPHYARGGSVVERLRKWGRRHPRLASGSSIGGVAAVILVGMVFGLAWLARTIDRREAAEQADHFASALDVASAPLAANRGDLRLLTDAISGGRALLEEYHALESNAWRDEKPYRLLDDDAQQRFAQNVVELQCLVAQAAIRAAEHIRDTMQEMSEANELIDEASRLNQLARPRSAPVPGALLFQRARIDDFHKDTATAAALRAEAKAMKPAGSFEQSLLMYVLGPNDLDSAQLKEFQNEKQMSSVVWFCLGNLWRAKGDALSAEGCFTTSIALTPDSFTAYHMRGTVRFEVRRYHDAIEDFDRAIELRPTWPPALFGRGLALQMLGRNEEALADLNAAIENGATETRIYFVRARLLENKGELDQAAKDLQIGLERQPSDWVSWISRGMAKMKDEQPLAALDDFEKAVSLNPRSLIAWRNIASVCSKRLGRLEKAIDAMDHVVELDPSSAKEHTTRGVLYGRLGRRAEALRDAAVALALEPQPSAEILYRVSSIYALTSVDHPEDASVAMQLLRDAAWRDPVMVGGYIKIDTDLAPLHSLPAFREFVHAFGQYRRQMRPGARPAGKPSA